MQTWVEVLGIGVTAAVLFTGCDRTASPVSKSGAPSGKSEPRPVKVFKAAERKLSTRVVALGSLLAHEQSTLSTKISGRVHAIFVDVGSPVKTGDKLAQIEPRDYELLLKQTEAALAQARVRLGLPMEGDNDNAEPEKISSVKLAQAVLKEARSNHERVQKLRDEGIISQADVEEANSSYEVALNRYQDAIEIARQQQAMVVQRRAEYEIARQQLTDTLIIAPFEGIIQERRAQLGEYITVGAPIVTLVKANPLRLRVEVADRDSVHLRLGQELSVMVEGNANAYTGRVDRISPALNETNRMLVIEADIANSGQLYAGSFARSEILNRDTKPVVAVPANALSVFAGVEKLFIILNDKVQERLVLTGNREGNWIEIVQGLSAGEIVVINPGNLRNGQLVAILPDKSEPAP